MAERQGLTLGAGTTPTTRARLAAPVAPRTTANVRIVAPNIPKLAPIQPRKREAKKEDKGIIGGLLSIPGSAAKAIGAGVAAIPQFVGKTAQTAYGFGEGIMDLALDAVDEDIYKSRFETDLDRARELGLKGDALVAYAAQRQYPLGAMIVQSAAGTGRRVAEVATAGRYDYGEPGIDYARAFREGDLGSFLVEDVGNAILAGRAVGAGNVVARAGAAVPGRTGRAIATTGRLIEEPIATTTRGVARATAAGAGRLQGATSPVASRLAGLANPAERVMQAERPIRQIFNELGESYRTIQQSRLDNLNEQIKSKMIERDAAQASGNIQRAENIEAEINVLKEQADRATTGTGVVKAGRAIVKRLTNASERNRQNIVAQFNRLAELGAAPETVETYRGRAASLREQAAAAGNEADAARLQAEAIANDNLADLKENFGDELSGPLPAYVQEAAIHYATRKSAELLEQAERGATPEQLVRSAFDPTIGPDLAGRGMAPTQEGVMAAVEYERSRQAQQSSLNPAQVHMIDAMYALMKEWSDFAKAAMARGQGMPDGPAPFYWFQPYPVPTYMLAAIDMLAGPRREAVTGELDNAVIFILDEAIRAGGTQEYGIIDDGIYKELGINPEKPRGAWKKLVKQGDKAVAKGENPLSYQVAYYAVQLSYKRLRAVAPELMANPDIYPAVMRPMILTRRQEVRRITGEEVLATTDRLLTIARDNADIIDTNVLTGVVNDVRRALDPRERINKSALDKVVKRLETIRQRAAERANELRKQEEGLTLVQENRLRLLDEVANAVYLIQTQLDQIAAEPAAGPSPKLVAAQRRVSDAEAAKAGASEEAARATEAIAAAEAAAEPQLAPLRVERARLSSEAQERSQKVAELVDDIDQTDSAISALDEPLRLLARVQGFIDDGVITGDEGAPIAVETVILGDLEQARAQRAERMEAKVTDKQAGAAKAEDVTLRQQAVDNAYGELEQLTGGSRFLLDFSPEEQARQGARAADTQTLMQEDFIAPVERIIPNSPSQPWLDEFLETYAETDGGLPVDEMADQYNRANGTDLSEGQYLERVARAFVARKEAEVALAQSQRRPLKEWKMTLADQASESFDDFIASGNASGLTLDQLERVAAILDPESRDAQVAKLSQLRSDRDALDNQRSQERQAVANLTSERDALDTRLRTPTPETREGLVRLTRAQAEARRLQRGLPGRRAAVTRLRRRPATEVQAELQQAERRRLRPVGEILRPEPGAEGPTVGRIKPRLLGRVQRTVADLERDQAKTVVRIKRLREKAAPQEALAAAAEAATPDVFQRDIAQQQPLGFELLPEGEMPLYIPAGPTRGMLAGRDIPLMIRGEGAGPQTRLQASQQRISGAFPMTAAGVAGRINEVLGQMYRNTTVEQLITDERLASNVQKILGPDRYNEIVEQGQRDADAQGVDRTSGEYESAVQQAVGERVIRELADMGYEVVSPVTIDPLTGTHAPVGDLTLSVTPRTVDANSIVMRRGVAQRLFSEFERQGARQLPAIIDNTLERLGNLTARWKSHILPISLRWQIGDAVGIVMFSWLRGDIPPGQLAARMQEVVARMTDPADPRIGAVLFSDLINQPIADPVLAAGFAAGLQARGLRMEDIRFLEQQNQRLTGERADVGRFRRYDQFRAKSFRLNEAINGLGRAAVYIENLDRILQEQGRSLDEIDGPKTINDPVITEAIQQAVEATNQTLGAFSDLTPWEKQVMRKVFPFWSWIKFINKAAFELAIDQPDRVLFYAHLGSMAADPDGSELSGWLQGKTPLLGGLFDLNFLNPYQDAFVFKGNPLTASAETFTSISPAFTAPLTAAGELYYAQTGRQLPLTPSVSRPSYLEGRPEATTRGLGDVLGGIGYIGLTQLGGPLRNVLTLLPEGRIPGTDVATGPVQRFNQGSLRTTGAYAEPRLGPIAGRLAAIGRTFGVPSPLITEEMALRQAREQAQRDRNARLRRIEERRRAGA